MKATVLACLLPLVALSQAKEPKYLVVKGRAEVQIPVEYVELSIGITTRDSTLPAASDSSRRLIRKLFAIFKDFGIPDSDFQTQNNSAGMSSYSNEYQTQGRPFTVSYFGTLRLRHLAMYDSLLQSLVSLGGINISIKQFDSTRRATYRMLGYRRAVDAARQEANLLLQGSHQSVGDIIKLIQDNRDLFTQYDDIDKLIPAPPTSSLSFMQAGVTTLRRDYISEQVELTVIFSIK